ncbi:hypothetical protein HW555_004789 [Spodoptera exigua]|uniref:Uncharacterized protein n=1 Tax=Spodoptera exigua TaxID=7107 RepID=A0A835L548_SPOEX|nr:hypothetical protein HW555_004789 [Spodoptera exigua]
MYTVRQRSGTNIGNTESSVRLRGMNSPALPVSWKIIQQLIIITFKQKFPGQLGDSYLLVEHRQTHSQSLLLQETPESGAEDSSKNQLLCVLYATVPLLSCHVTFTCFLFSRNRKLLRIGPIEEVEYRRTEELSAPPMYGTTWSLESAPVAETRKGESLKNVC